MMTIKVLMIGALCLFLTVGLSESRITTKQHYYPNSYIGIDFSSFENETLSYAACEKTEKQTEKNCSIVIENSNIDGSYKRDVCKIVLKTEGMNTVISNTLRVVPFGKNRVIVVWMENSQKVDKVDEDAITEAPTIKSLVKFSTVHFPACKVVEAKLPVTRYQRYNGDWFIEDFLFAIYADGYDVAIQDRKSCNYGFCKVTFDSEGRKTSDPVPWFQDNQYFTFYPVVPGSPIKGHVVLGHKKNYIVRDTDVIDLMQYNLHSDGTLSFSNNYGTLRFCNAISDNNIVKCTQYDEQGVKKLETEVNFSYPVSFAILHNSPSDEFFLFYVESTGSSLKNTVYHMAKIDANGKIKKDIVIEGFKCDRSENAFLPKFSDNGNGKFCLSLLCFENEDSSHSKKERGYFTYGYEYFNYADF